MLEVHRINKRFSSGGIFKKNYITAVDDVSFSINRGETLGLVGESGCGKTTVGKLVLRLIEPTSGKIIFDGVDVTKLRKKELRKLRPRMQMIFQDPDSSLDPRMKIGDSIAEPFRLRGGLSRRVVGERVSDLVETVGLSPEHVNRYPYQMSGGQNQRVVLARALAANPDFVVADEPTSGLDVSVQAQLLNLMNGVKSDLALTIMFITHDLEVVRYMSDRVAVMYGGKILEVGDTEYLFDHAEHPYTRELLAQQSAEDYYVPEDDVNNGDGGCVFCSRCPFAEEVCKNKEPVMVNIGRDHQVLCHRV